MDSAITISIDPQSGSVSFLVSESTKNFLSDEAIIRRASHVEPTNPLLRWLFHGVRYVFGEDSRAGNWTRRWPVKWRVNLFPIDGPILSVIYNNRDEAIQAEIDWLERNWL